MRIDKEAYYTFVKSWLDGIDFEIQYWSTFIKEKGGEVEKQFARLLTKKPNFRLEKYVSGNWPLKVLDVGAGPISGIGIVTPLGEIHLSACDPLALYYDKILYDNGIIPYVKTEFSLVERLTDVYAEEHFDIVHMQNAIDHCFDPFIGIAEMLRVVKTNGTVLLYHRENEAEYAQYSGFHQWNVSEKDGSFIIWRKDTKYCVDEILNEFAKMTTTRELVGNRWYIRNELIKIGHPQRNIDSQLNYYDCIIVDVVYKQNKAIMELTNKLSIMDAEKSLYRNKISELLMSNEAVLNSVCWKITKPLRFILDRLITKNR